MIFLSKKSPLQNSSNPLGYSPLFTHPPVKKYLVTNCRGEHEASLQIIFHADLVQLLEFILSLGCKPTRLPTGHCFYLPVSTSITLSLRTGNAGSQAKKLDL
jgi:hypothetical protein